MLMKIINYTVGKLAKTFKKAQSETFIKHKVKNMQMGCVELK